MSNNVESYSVPKKKFDLDSGVGVREKEMLFGSKAEEFIHDGSVVTHLGYVTCQECSGYSRVGRRRVEHDLTM